MAEDKKTQNPARFIIDSMVLRPARVQTEDIGSWVEAVNSAKKGYRTKLYNLYENIMTDPFLSDAIDKRVNAITNTEIVFTRDGQEVEEITDLIDSIEFEELIREIMLSKAWGKSVIDVSFSPEFNVFSVPRKHIRIDKLDRPLVERKRYILKNETDLTGYDYENDPYIIEVGKDDDLGFIYRAAQYVIYKRGGFGDWAQFAEIFGMPFLIGKYNGFDPNAKQKLFEALSEIGSNPRAAIPKEAELQVVENKSSGSNTLYKDLKDACNEEILIAVLGNTMTTLSGSSRSQSETHRETQEDINKSDRRFVQRVLNKLLVPMLLKRGYPVAGGKFTFPDAGETISTEKRLEMALSVKKAGVAVDDDYIYELTGIPAPKNPQKPTDPNSPPDKGGVPGEDGGGGKNPKPQAPGSKPKKKGLRNFFGFAPEAKPGLSLKGLWNSLVLLATGKITTDDGYSIDFDRLFTEAIKEVYGGDVSPVNKSLFNLTNDAIQHAFTVEFGKEDEEWGKGNADFVADFRKYGAEFCGFKAHNLTKEFIALVYNEDGTQKPFKQYKKECNALKPTEVRHLQTQYNTAIKTTRAAINYRRYLATENVYPNLEYTESNASHKRKDHVEYVGTILPIRHPWWQKHMPPGAWNCQCGVKPTNKPATPVPTEETVDPVFSNNPGETAKFIVTEETPYYTNTEARLISVIIAAAAMLESLRQQLENEPEEEEQ